MVLDHLIATVPDIRATHARLVGLGFEEAWPIGPFWPAALTSGIALGGANLELVQHDSGAYATRIQTLVLAPASLAEGRAYFGGHGLEFEEREKIEPDPTLLALRGFPREAASSPQTICTNLYPIDPAYPFFLCLYAPFLKARLAPGAFAPRSGPFALSLIAPDPDGARRLFAETMQESGVDLLVESGETPAVSEIRFADGSVLTADDLEVRKVRDL